MKRPDGRCRRLGLSRNAELSLRTTENGSAACDLPPECPKKKSWADLTHLAHFAKSKPRDYRKWIRSVRFTPRGSEKKRSCADLTHLAHLAKTKPRDYQKWIRSVRFTPRGSQKREFGRFDAFGEFGGFRAFGGCTEYNVAGRTRAHITLAAEDSELRTQNSGLRTQDSGLRTQDSELRTQDSGLRTQDSGLYKRSKLYKPLDSELNSEASDW